ncbi:phage terminase large subunit [Altererythrobacter salegens]|uniref:Phage terminase large subunit n=1 Tax=Croceibacterium salegens TaxID=1737568 RepID=A0A6I4SZP6_9SPHN|nr:phage terminase large subunit [Croceibacterium salegens]MXO61343.1 phage terminase large subunit [Croceibacterium salegens]
MKLDPNALTAARRQHLPLFLMKVFETLHPGDPPLEMAWYLQAICHALCEVRRGNERRLVVTVPPRHLKSVTASVAFVAWVLGHDPKAKIMVASYSQDLARHHSNLTRTVMESDWYKKDFPRTRISDRGNRALELETTAGGVRKAVSVGGSITGFGADYIIVDDCMKADEAKSALERQNLRDWLDNTLLSRLNDKATGKIISIQQRLHEDDLPAYMLEKGYAHLNLPAIAEKEEHIPTRQGLSHHRLVGDLLNPARENRETLDQLRRDLGPVVFSAQYQQEPVTAEGNMIRLEWFGTYEEAPPRHEFLKVVQSWDTGMTAAPTSDWTVCTTWGFHREEKRWYLLDVFRKRLDFPDLRRAVVDLRKRYRADKMIMEKAGSGFAIYQDLRSKGDPWPIMIQPVSSKEERFNGCLAEVEAGHFVLPADASWLADFRFELRAFPQGKYDDQVDSFSQFVKFQMLNWRWILTDRCPDGRVKRIVRLDARPW